MRARGQATVELALGSIVYVTVLVVGIHFAEAAWISIKVQEAQTWAVWETTHRRVQQRSLDGDSTLQPFDDTINGSDGVAQQAQRRYQDFNGLSSVGTSRSVIALAMTQGQGMDIACRADPAFAGSDPSFQPSAHVASVYDPAGGLWCRAEATLKAINMPKSFLQADDGSFFQASPFRMEAMKVCGMGYPRNGKCEGHLALLTNDWGFVGPKETAECKLDCQVSPYRGATSKVFDTVKGWSRGPALAATFAGDPGASPDEFYFSFSGVESGHTQNIPTEMGGGPFNTGGPGVGMLAAHSKAPFVCFLGRKSTGCSRPAP